MTAEPSQVQATSQQVGQQSQIVQAGTMCHAVGQAATSVRSGMPLSVRQVQVAPTLPPGSLFDALDSNHDGVLSREELAGKLLVGGANASTRMISSSTSM